MSRAELLLLDEPTSGLDPLIEREFRRCVGEAKAAGQTVFLSSHILSEVEALCDRVAILRSGRLVEVGTLAELRHLSALQVEATFSQTPPDLSLVPGTSDIEVDGNRVRLRVHGSVEPLLARLTAVGVTQLLSREPSLEELLLAQYGAEPSARTKEVTPSAVGTITLAGRHPMPAARFPGLATVGLVARHLWRGARDGRRGPAPRARRRRGSRRPPL